MNDELENAAKLIDELVGLERFEVVRMPCNNPKVRLYGARELIDLTVGTPPVVIADNKGVRILESKKWRDAWDYAYEHGLEPPIWVFEKAREYALNHGLEPPARPTTNPA